MKDFGRKCVGASKMDAGEMVCIKKAIFRVMAKMMP